MFKTRKRNKTCSAKAINKDFIENEVIKELDEKVFFPKALDTISKHIYKYSKNQASTIKDDLTVFETELNNIQGEIDNIDKGLSFKNFGLKI